MLGQLEDAIDQLDLPIDTAALASVLGQRDRLDARITELVAAVDAARLWDLDDSTSVTASVRRRRRPGRTGGRG